MTHFGKFLFDFHFNFVFHVEQAKKSIQHSENLSVAIRADNIEEVVKALLSGVNINTKTKDGQSILYISACTGSTDITKMLLGRGADYDIKNSYGRTVLHQLTLEGFKSMFDLLMGLEGINVNAVDDFGKSILHTAAEWGRKDFLAPLIKVFQSLCFVCLLFLFIFMNLLARSSSGGC